MTAIRMSVLTHYIPMTEVSEHHWTILNRKQHVETYLLIIRDAEPFKYETVSVLFKDPFRTAQKTLCVGFKTVKLMLYREIIAVCSEIHTKHINALWAEHRISEC